MDHQPTKERLEQIEKALASGRKIEAIKLYREATGKGLKEAKDHIESLESTMSIKSIESIPPEQRNQEPQGHASLKSEGSGCASVILFGVVLAAGAAWTIASYI